MSRCSEETKKKNNNFFYEKKNMGKNKRCGGITLTGRYGVGGGGEQELRRTRQSVRRPAMHLSRGCSSLFLSWSHLMVTPDGHTLEMWRKRPTRTTTGEIP